MSKKYMADMSEFDQMRALGQAAIQFSTKWFDNPTSIAADFSDRLLYSQTGMRTRDLDTAEVHNLYTNGLLAGMWAASGFPTVTLGHRTAAAFAATKMRPSDASEFVRAPWPAIGIRLPSDLIFVDDMGTPSAATFVLACAIPEAKVTDKDNSVRAQSGIDVERWWFKILAPTNHPDARKVREQAQMSPAVQGYFSGVCLWGFNLGARHLVAPTPQELDEEGTYETWRSLEQTAMDDRTDRVARMLIAATCLYLGGDPRERAERAKSDGITITERKSKKREGDELPQYTQFEITSSLRINLHHAVRDFVIKGGASPSVQTLVAGHWKRVPHGPKASLRKLVHVAPYWRGDVDAPISSRVR